MTKSIYKQSIIILTVAILVSFFFNWKKLPVSILIGGTIALLNFKGLSWGVNGFLSTDGAKIKLIFLSILRIAIIFAALFFIIYFRLVDILGLLLGLTLVFIITLKEGFLYSSRDL